MSSAGVPPFETILKLCQQAGGEPWHPGEFAASLGLDPRKLAGPLVELQRAGLIDEAECEPGCEPGYVLTTAGAAVLKNPRLMALLRTGELPHVEQEVPAEMAGSVDRVTAVMKRLMSSERPYAAYAILAANLIVLLASMHIALGGNWGRANIRLLIARGDPAALHQVGAVNAGDVADGRWWRLLTTMFVHRDIFHLLINMTTFMAFARLAERYWGCLRFLAVYLIAGFGSVCLALWNDPTQVPIGASGGLCGVMLSLAAWYLLNKRYMPREVFTTGLRQVGFGFLWWMMWMGLIALLADFRFWWVGHVAGAAIGLFTGVVLNYQQFLQHPARWMFVLLVAVIPLACFGLLLRGKDTDPAWHDAIAKIKKKREEEQQRAKAQEEKKRKDKEFELFDNQILPATKPARDFIKHEWKSIKSLCDDDPADRKADDVMKAKQLLRDAKEKTDSALATLAAVGPIETEKVERAIIAERNYLKDQKRLIELAQRCFDAGAGWTEKDKKELEDQEDTTKRTYRIFESKLTTE